ncbi:DegT/DnrJ/EryC1/StrS aminotransferase family protein [Sinorhizobium sp. NFACC03]|uniref:DegT/DnrJ/EryC1/StrS family aminotransferase n=1 Tax=Sinorhizobium sp. NFACC03 TaxID=1566295 RepID=UPI00088949DE|nr:DegT/DnrJ/EryC1/StrS aminotransferase family protein [Sinorhizobium sp. NFACC03]SDA92817.1 dTDP-4-amino-4,6-dideoxygalactose transaminase [Sinorhizobium sp. NFACC03]
MPKWPFYDEPQIERVVAVLRSGEVNAWTGRHVRDFEAAYEAFLGVRHAIALANGTVALELALFALGLGKGDEVIVTPRSFIASASCVVMAGATPIFADVDLASQNVTVETILTAITPRTKGIIAVHLAGWPCDMPAIMELARDKGLWVVEDCAQAHGAEIAGRPIGSFADMSAFSFCQDKIITTGGEGGLLATNDEELWQRAWSRKDHGKSRHACFDVEHPPGFRWLHESIGTNWRMTSIQATLGRYQLDKLFEWREHRARNAVALFETTSKFDALRTPMPPRDCQHAWYRFYTFVVSDRLGEGWTRDRIVEEINRAGLACFSGSCPEIYRERAFSDLGLAPARALPNAQLLGESSIAFLVDPTIDTNASRHACTIVADVLSRASRHRISATA